MLEKIRRLVINRVSVSFVDIGFAMQGADKIVRRLHAQNAVLLRAQHKRRTSNPLDLV